MNKIFLLRLSLYLALVLSVNLPAKSQDEKLKAIFVYNFTKYVNWPQRSGNFVITVIGKSPISAEIISIASKKTVGNSTIEVKVVNVPEEVMESQIVYIPASKNNALSVIKEKSPERHFLIITEKPEACKAGSCINFVNRDGRLSFEISKINMESYGLGVSSDLLKLGTVVTN
jgi:hypothetical protein